MTDQSPTNGTMTSAERASPLVLIRQRERVAKADIEEYKARLLADFAKQLAAVYRPANDPIWAEARQAAEAAVAEADAKVAARCQELGIIEKFRPSIEACWYGRGENATASRRAELLRVATIELDAQAKRAHAAVAKASVELQTELVASGLSSEAARAFLAQMPTPRCCPRSPSLARNSCWRTASGADSRCWAEGGGAMNRRLDDTIRRLYDTWPVPHRMDTSHRPRSSTRSRPALRRCAKSPNFTINRTPAMHSLASDREIAGRFGLRRIGRTWRGNCPTCAYRDAAVLLPARGDQPSRLWCANGCDLNSLNGTSRPRRAQQPEDRQTIEKARRLWNGAVPCAGTAAERYLVRRGLPHLVASPALRFRADCPHPEQHGRVPALIAAVEDFTGQLVAVHRTYLTYDGHKATVTPPRASLGRIGGNAIRLSDPIPDKRLVIGEGIESSASCGVLTEQPAWAAVSAGNLGWRLILPLEISLVLVAADRDPPGIRAAEAAADRWRAEDRDVLIASPDRLGTDFNDILLGQKGYQR
jgi:hypothetical protein